jgi:hypothetical protein
VLHLALVDIHDCDRVVAELGHEEASPRQVDRHVIDPAADIAEWDLALKLERERFRRLSKGPIHCK